MLQPPGEAVLLAGIWKVTGDDRYIYLQVLQALVDSLMVLLVYRITIRLFRRPLAALLAAAGYAVFLPVILLDRIPHLDAWAVYFTIAIVAAWLEGLYGPRRVRWLVLAGVLTGLGVYFRPGVLLLAPMMSLVPLIERKWRLALTTAAIPLAVAAVLLVPWTVRNADRFHRFIPIRTGIGQNLWEGLGEVHNNFGAVLDDQVTLNQVHAVRPDLVYGSPAYDSYLEHKAVTAIREHPGVMLHAVARRVAITTFGLHTLPGALGIRRADPVRPRGADRGLDAAPLRTREPASGGSANRHDPSLPAAACRGSLRAPGVVRVSDLGWPGRGSRLRTHGRAGPGGGRLRSGRRSRPHLPRAVG